MVDSQINSNGILCENQFDTGTNKSSELASYLSGCRQLRDSIHLKIGLKPTDRRTIVNDSFGIFNLGMHTPKHLLLNLMFLQLKGFDIESKIPTSVMSVSFNTDFNLYKRNRLVTSCSDFLNSTSQGFIFKSARSFGFVIIRPKAVHPVCSLFFGHARLENIVLSHMIHSYFLNNILTFIDSTSESFNNLNSTVSSLSFSQIYGLDVDSKILNAKIFAATSNIEFNSNLINSIESNVFKSFKFLLSIYFDSFDLMQLIRKQGIEWIKNINYDVNVNLADSFNFNKTGPKLVKIILKPSFEFYVLSKTKNFAHEHDFCLIVDFPFNQMVNVFESEEIVINRIPTQSARRKSPSPEWYNCAELWFKRFYKFYFFYQSSIQELIMNSTNFSACHYEQRIDNCNKTNFKVY